MPPSACSVTAANLRFALPGAGQHRRRALENSYDGRIGGQTIISVLRVVAGS